MEVRNAIAVVIRVGRAICVRSADVPMTALVTVNVSTRLATVTRAGSATNATCLCARDSAPERALASTAHACVRKATGERIARVYHVLLMLSV